MNETIIEVRDHRDHGWFWAQNELLDNHGKEIGVYGVAVYMALARFANNHTQRAWPGLRKLASMLGTGRKQVRAAIDTLESAHLITVERRPNNSNVYTLNNLKAQPIVEGGVGETPPMERVGSERPHLVSQEPHLGAERPQGGVAEDPELDLRTILTEQSLNQDWDSSLFANKLWEHIKKDAQLEMTAASFDLWLKPSTGARFQNKTNTLIVTLASQSAVDWVATRLHKIIQRSMDYHIGAGYYVAFTTGGKDA